MDSQRFRLLNEDRLTAARGNVERSLIATYKPLCVGWEREGEQFVPEHIKAVMNERTDWGELLNTGFTDEVPSLAE